VYHLLGGELNVGDLGIISTSRLYEFDLGDATLGALAGWTSTVDIVLTGDGDDPVVDTDDFDIVLSGYLTGEGGLVKRGAGTLAITNINDFTGDTLVSEGTLAGSGSSDNSAVTIANGARLSPDVGDIGDFYTGQLTLEAWSVFEVEV